jgi:sulfide:quinone oxidoreductase
MPKIRAMGFKTLINNRPDREVLFQPRTKSLKARALQAGLGYHDLPVISGQITQEDIQAFKALLAAAEKPVLAFCRTGTRSATLWADANPDELTAQENSFIGEKAGYAH